MTAVLFAGNSCFRVVELPPPAPCPPWCRVTAECGAHREERHHEATAVNVGLGEPDVTALVVACRDDDDLRSPDPGVPYVWLAGDGPTRGNHDWAEALTPAAALQLGQALIAAAIQAADLVPAGVQS
ncbi:DUF6907 domain-containing protein [Dactylosporangium sp. CA-152071]|uniref:DUF6907 domain-containing protein n=1 Tax=Dactylosporangium sp. CA-152071 TaxID=3239933 RepID=UPI003D90EF4D